VLVSPSSSGTTPGSAMPGPPTPSWSPSVAPQPDNITTSIELQDNV